MHDEFVQLLVAGLRQLSTSTPSVSTSTESEVIDAPSTSTITSTSNNGSAEVKALAANYHRKLQAFLLSSVDYHPNR